MEGVAEGIEWKDFSTESVVFGFGVFFFSCGGVLSLERTAVCMEAARGRSLRELLSVRWESQVGGQMGAELRGRLEGIIASLKGKNLGLGDRSKEMAQK